MAKDGGGGRGGLGTEASAEKVLRGLLVHLVDPLLFSVRVSGKAPTAEQKADVCTQMHSVVILYDYYRRKQFPQLEYLDHEAFCKKAVIVQPCLLKFVEPGNHVERVSLKKAIMAACNISSALDPSRENVEIEGWPISRIAVFLVDSEQENCFLQFGSITKGVWGMMEMELGKVFKKPLVERTGTKTLAAGSKRPNECSHAPLRDEDDLGQLALSMVEEKTGISHSNFYILESHMTYSLSQEKTASRLYIIKSMKPIDEVIDGITMIPLAELQDIFTSVHEQCSLPSDKVHLSKNHEFHRSSNEDDQIMSLSSRNAILTVNEAASKQKYPSSRKDSANVIFKAETDDVGSSLEMNELPAIKGHFVTDRRGLDTCSIKCGGGFSQFCSNGANNGLADKASMTGLDKKPRLIESKDGESSLTLVSDTDHPLVPFHSYPGGYEFHHLMASKKDELKEASLRVLQKKRDDLTLQLRHHEDESAQCEMNIQAVRNDREGSLKLELESIIEACNGFCSSQMYVSTSLGRNHPQEINSKGLSEGVFSSRSFHARNWMTFVGRTTGCCQDILCSPH